MTISITNPFKSQTAKFFRKTSRDMHAEERPGRTIFKFGTTITDGGSDLSRAKSSECAGLSSSGHVWADAHANKQKDILFKVRSAKNSIANLFRATGRDLATTPCSPFVIDDTDSIENCNTDDFVSALSIPFTSQPEDIAVTVYDTIPTTRHDSEAIVSAIPCVEDVDERIDLSGLIPCDSTEASSLFCTPLSTFSPEELHAIMEGDEGVAGASASRISLSTNDSGIAVYLSSDTFSDLTTASEIGLISSVVNASHNATSLATSVDADDDHRFLTSALRGLRRVPNYEDLRSLQTVVDQEPPCPDISCRSSNGEMSGEATASSHAAPLRRPTKFSLFVSKICKFPSRRFPVRLDARFREFCDNTKNMSVFRPPNKLKLRKVVRVSRDRHGLQDTFDPSLRVQANAFEPSSRQPPPWLMPPIWSCAKITRSRSKKRQRITKQSMRELKARLDSIDTDPWS